MTILRIWSICARSEHPWSLNYSIDPCLILAKPWFPFSGQTGSLYVCYLEKRHTIIFSLGLLSTQPNWAQVSFSINLNETWLYYCNRCRWAVWVQISHHRTLDWIEGLNFDSGLVGPAKLSSFNFGWHS